ncbi:frataxin-like domain containing protein [Nitzschia inconspicua]|uniref:Frataxin-like domain containing protein n=1 Tax=Nitzschia inconspicua TaxID=303405 RepID=A0A9K3M5A7_9STRA|nr:frataxin-like domain containing protein [Nitzschia inconspicua]
MLMMQLRFVQCPFPRISSRISGYRFSSNAYLCSALSTTQKNRSDHQRHRYSSLRSSDNISNELQRHSLSNEYRRYFQSESAYHRVADETLEDIQDAVEKALEEHSPTEEYEVVLASGVLTMTLPPHGTWVLNKQTPNKQIWWSSPLSGPRRYEYEDGEWVFTRDESHSLTLAKSMMEEFQQIYNIELDLE